jgi:hypothetical protein
MSNNNTPVAPGCLVVIFIIVMLSLILMASAGGDKDTSPCDTTASPGSAQYERDLAACLKGDY